MKVDKKEGGTKMEWYAMKDEDGDNVKDAFGDQHLEVCMARKEHAAANVSSSSSSAAPHADSAEDPGTSIRSPNAAHVGTAPGSMGIINHKWTAPVRPVKVGVDGALLRAR